VRQTVESRPARTAPDFRGLGEVAQSQRLLDITCLSQSGENQPNQKSNRSEHGHLEATLTGLQPRFVLR